MKKVRRSNAALVQRYLVILERRRNYIKHLDRLASMQPIIETSEIPMAPRLVAFRKRSKSYRSAQRRIDADNTSSVVQSYRARQIGQRKRGSEVSRDWVADLPYIHFGENRSGENQRPSTRTPRTPTRTPAAAMILFNEPISANEIYEPTGLEDGMKVTDQGAQSSRPQPRIIQPSGQPSGNRSARNARPANQPAPPNESPSDDHYKRKTHGQQTQTNLCNDDDYELDVSEEEERMSKESMKGFDELDESEKHSDNESKKDSEHKSDNGSENNFEDDSDHKSENDSENSEKSENDSQHSKKSDDDSEHSKKSDDDSEHSKKSDDDSEHSKKSDDDDNDKKSGSAKLSDNGFDDGSDDFEKESDEGEKKVDLSDKNDHSFGDDDFEESEKHDKEEKGDLDDKMGSVANNLFGDDDEKNKSMNNTLGSDFEDDFDEKKSEKSDESYHKKSESDKGTESDDDPFAM